MAEKTPAGLKVLETGLITTRLGEGIGGGVLLPGAMERTAGAVSQLLETARRLGSRRVVAAATSAVRDAGNRDEFLTLVRKKTGLAVRVLSGREEAALSYRGVLSGLAVEARSTAVMDVGGGSTELIWQEGASLRLASVNVGAVRLTEAGLDEGAAAALLGPVLEEVRLSPVKCLVGVGGTVTTLAALDQQLDPYDRDRVHGYCLTTPRVHSIQRQLGAMALEERRRLPGLQPERADIIVAGVMIVKLVLDGLGLERLLASESDILHGLVLEEVETN